MDRCKQHASRDRMIRALVALCAICAGCGYGEVSPAAYGYAEAVYAVASRRAVDRVDDLQTRLDRAQAEGQLSDREAGWLRELVGDCRAERWTEAQHGARRLIESQASGLR
jgi:hypothetical protein